MNIVKLQLTGFYPYDTLEYDGVNGVTLITGANGAGKSTIIEALGWVLYEESIRGASRSHGEVKLIAQLDAQLVTVERSRRKARAALTLHVGDEDRTGATMTETQARIVTLFGSWERFCSTRVFAKEFLARFGAATDRERKALLEEVLGLGQFDAASDCVRGKLRTLRDEVFQHESKAGGLVEAIMQAQKHIDHLLGTKRIPDAIQQDIDLVQTKLAAIETRLPALSQVVLSASAEATEAKQHRYNLRGEIERQLLPKSDKLTARIHNIANIDQCPTCLQKMNAEHRANVRAELEGELTKVRARIDDIQKDLASADAAMNETAEQHLALVTRVSALEKDRSAVYVKRQVLASELSAANLHVEMQEHAINGHAQLKARWEEHTNAANASRLRLAEFQAADEVFGLRGARVMLLGRALGRLEEETNRVLARLSNEIQIKLDSVQTQASGKQVDRIDITIIGAGMDPSLPAAQGQYKACSSGQRARIDVALLLGLAAMSSDSGFIAFDEVFDSLDAEGVERVSNYLDELGHEREVLVITHHDDLRTQFPRARVLHASCETDKSAALAAG